ncbi:MAG: cytochrome c oxidase assembly protein [Frankia sp.]
MTQSHQTALTVGRVFTVWQLNVPATVGVALLAALYLWGARRVAVAHPRRPWPRRRTASFLLGLAVVVVAIDGAIDVYGATLFWIHMIGHLALIMVAPALLVTGRPLTLLLHSSRNPVHTWTKRVLRAPATAALTSPPAALATYTVTIVGTHLTGLMKTIMMRPWVGALEHVAYLAVGVQFFLLVFGDEPIRWRLSMPARLGLLAGSMAVDTFTGIALMQSTHPVGMASHPGWGPSPLADTQAAGGIMWVGGDGLMVVLTLALFATWAYQPDRPRLRGGWLEQVRLAAFDQRTGFPAPPAAGSGRHVDLDTDEERREAYNAWLAHLAGQPPRRAAPAPRPGPTR